MQNLKNKFKPTNTEEQETNPLAEKFKQAQETPATKIVTLVYAVICGCGFDDIKLERVVPADSNLRDGDRIEKLEVGDKVIDGGMLYNIPPEGLILTDD